MSNVGVKNRTSLENDDNEKLNIVQLVSNFFHTHCCLERFEINESLDIDCINVTQSLVEYLVKEDNNSEPVLVKMIISGPYAPQTLHWVVKWKGYLIDPTILQFYRLDDNAKDKIRKKWCDGKNIAIENCSQEDAVHPDCTYDLVTRGVSCQEFGETIPDSPYFIGPENEHPLIKDAVLQPVQFDSD
jgi:hypothetical protein